MVSDTRAPPGPQRTRVLAPGAGRKCAAPSHTSLCPGTGPSRQPGPPATGHGQRGPHSRLPLPSVGSGEKGDRRARPGATSQLSSERGPCSHQTPSCPRARLSDTPQLPQCPGAPAAESARLGADLWGPRGSCLLPPPTPTLYLPQFPLLPRGHGHKRRDKREGGQCRARLPVTPASLPLCAYLPAPCRANGARQQCVCIHCTHTHTHAHVHTRTCTHTHMHSHAHTHWPFPEGGSIFSCPHCLMEFALRRPPDLAQRLSRALPLSPSDLCSDSPAPSASARSPLSSASELPQQPLPLSLSQAGDTHVSRTAPLTARSLRGSSNRQSHALWCSPRPRGRVAGAGAWTLTPRTPRPPLPRQTWSPLSQQKGDAQCGRADLGADGGLSAPGPARVACRPLPHPRQPGRQPGSRSLSPRDGHPRTPLVPPQHRSPLQTAPRRLGLPVPHGRQTGRRCRPRCAWSVHHGRNAPESGHSLWHHPTWSTVGSRTREARTVTGAAWRASGRLCSWGESRSVTPCT